LCADTVLTLEGMGICSMAFAILSTSPQQVLNLKSQSLLGQVD